MSNVRTFAPRRPTAASAPLPVPSPAEVRRQIEEAAQSALDIADRLIALLNKIEGDTDQEDGGDAEPSLGAPEGHVSQIVWLRGSSSDTELDVTR
ncbi:hypothetical protein [Methylobacterium goesingense]|uniref:Uncharacterized protein n=1 Tax=Methylobacterium goesingense TaxID=243690 RepID=A0ABV2LF69_9HYPH|nr:hypothetical protein [Methylobacterium goesingense]GJD73855.1 hypothetical protein CFIICLFH_2085 [Methylobacterium goesingense]